MRCYANRSAFSFWHSATPTAAYAQDLLPAHDLPDVSATDLPNAPRAQPTDLPDTTTAPPSPKITSFPIPPMPRPRMPIRPDTLTGGRPPVSIPTTKPDPAYIEHYQWRGLIWQSVEFNVAENGFRAIGDSGMRDILAHRPFWHDWLASAKQFNMRRWNDGDSFIVNYVGHPLQGAIASYIEIQNSPTQRRLQFGRPRLRQGPLQRLSMVRRLQYPLRDQPRR